MKIITNILNKKFNKNKSFFSKDKKMIYNTLILTKLKSSSLSISTYQNKCLEVPLFSNKKYIKLFTFLPFETPSLLFLPKMGIILLYSSSFSIIN